MSPISPIFSMSFRFLNHLIDLIDRIRCGTAKSDVEHIIETHQKYLTLETLPVEILQYIASLLDPESAACFTLCSKSLRWSIGNQSWFALRTEDQKRARLNFLNSLQRDLRDWLLCYHCEKLHPFEWKQESHRTWSLYGESSCTQADGVAYLVPSFGFRFPYAQMIMKIHKQGATKNIGLDSFFDANASTWSDNFTYSYVSARIAKNELLVKLEWRILLHQGEGFSRVRRVFPHVCPHWRCTIDDHALSRRISCQISHGPGQTCVQCTGMKQCQDCSTEFITAYLESNWTRQGHAVYVTAWKNYGPCDTPFDLRWRCHLLCIHTSLPAPKTSTPFAPGSIRGAFEDLNGSKIRTDGLSNEWPLDSDAEFSRLVADIGNQT